MKMSKYRKSKNNVDISLTMTEGSKQKIINITTEKSIELSNMIASEFGLIKDGDLIHDIVGDQGFQRYKNNNLEIIPFKNQIIYL